MDEFDGKMADAHRRVKGATLLGMGANLALGAMKMGVGWMSSSAALVADGYHSLSDVIASVVVLIGVDIAQRPADSEHPYGHGKAEVVAAKMVSLLLIAIGAWAMYGSLVGLHGLEGHPIPGAVALVAAAISIVVKEGLYHYKIRLGRHSGSKALIAEAWHHRSDAFSSVVSFLAIGGAIVGGASWGFVDHVGAVAIGVIIAWTGVRLFVQSSSELLDAVVTGPPLETVRRCTTGVAGVQAVEKVFVRKAGLDLLIDLHIEVCPELTVREGHAIGHQVKGCIMEAMPAVKSVLVHVEPHAAEGEKDGEHCRVCEEG